MINDVRTVLWKEWREILSQQGKLSLLLFFGTLGVIYPLMIGGGGDFTEQPANLFMYMFLPLVIVMGTMVDAIAGERERKTLETLLASRLSNEAILLGKIAATGLYMMAITIGSLLLSLATVNIFHGQGRLLMYPVPLLLAALVFSFFGTGLVASLSVLVSLHAPTVKHAYQRLSLAFLLIMIPLWFVLVPSPLQKRLVEWIVSGSSEQVNFAVVTLIIAGIFAICDAVLFALALKRFNRTQMILD